MPSTITAKEQWDGRKGGVDDQGVETLYRVFLLETSDELDDVPQVVTAVPVRTYDPHPRRPGCIARTIQVTPFEGSRSWKAEIMYSNARLAAKSGDVPTAQNPSSPSRPSDSSSASTPAQDRPPSFKFSRVEQLVAAEEDVNGVPCVNTAGDKFEGLEIDQPILAIEIKYFSVNLTTAHITSYWNKVNGSAWKGFAARTLVVKDFQFDETYDTIAEGSFGLVQSATITLWWNPKTWVKKVLNAGRRERISAPGGSILRAICDDTGQPVSEPVPLTAAGRRWQPGHAYHWVEFWFNADANFGGLIV